MHTGLIPGGRRSVVAMLALSTRRDSPSVKTTMTRWRAAGAKKLRVWTAPSAASVVPIVWKYAVGGGCWAVIACSSVGRNASSSALGSRCGSVRSVSDAMPTGTSGNARRRLSASTFARSSRLAPVVPDASIEREMSKTKITSASARTRWLRLRAKTGCAAASPTRIATVTTAAAVV